MSRQRLNSHEEQEEERHEVSSETLTLRDAAKNKSVFGYLRTLTTWHCPHSPATAAAIDRYLLPNGHTAVHLQRVCCRGPMLGQTDRLTDKHRTVS